MGASASGCTSIQASMLCFVDQQSIALAIRAIKSASERNPAPNGPQVDHEQSALVPRSGRPRQPSHDAARGLLLHRCGLQSVPVSVSAGCSQCRFQSVPVSVSAGCSQCRFQSVSKTSSGSSVSAPGDVKNRIGTTLMPNTRTETILVSVHRPASNMGRTILVREEWANPFETVTTRISDHQYSIYRAPLASRQIQSLLSSSALAMVDRCMLLVPS